MKSDIGDKIESPRATQELPPLTDAEKHDAFEWLRNLGLSTGPNARLAYVALRAWQEERRTPPSAAPCSMSGIYVASRVKQAEVWKDYRARGWKINSTWIDEAGEGETADFGDLWARIRDEIARSHCLVFYAAGVEDFPFKGALVEVGMALAMGKRVLVALEGVMLDGRTMRPVGSWLLDRNVHRYDTLEEAMDVARGVDILCNKMASSPSPAVAECDHEWSRPEGFSTRKCSKCGVIEPRSTVEEITVIDPRVMDLVRQHGATMTNSEIVQKFLPLERLASSSIEASKDARHWSARPTYTFDDWYNLNDMPTDPRDIARFAWASALESRPQSATKGGSNG